MVRSHLSELPEQVNPRRQKNKGYEGGGRGTLFLIENGTAVQGDGNLSEVDSGDSHTEF